MCVLRYPTTRAVLERNDRGTPLSMIFVCEGCGSDSRCHYRDRAGAFSPPGNDVMRRRFVDDGSDRAMNSNSALRLRVL